MRKTSAYSIAENHLCSVCHGKPDKGQEDFDCCCCRPDNPFSRENKFASQRRKNVRTHTQRHYQDGCIYYQEALHPPSNYEEGITPQKLI